ncbi:MAG: tRNA dimethylallyltransferase [Bacteroidia bacterium]|nr:tRNA dimethylallyltransferase [Bacteroidia bacterium]
MNNNLIVVLGPTGVGKTDISIDLAHHLGCEIISADSRQFYREMKIGTAVPSDDQLSIVKHHFIRFLPVDSYYSSSLFERDVLDLLPGLFSKKDAVIMAGGSGMYIDAVCHGIDDIPDVEQETRIKYNDMYLESGIEGLRRALKLMDPDHYNKVDLKNHKRIIRALEICESTGRPYSSFLQSRKIDFFDGRISKDKAIDLIKRNSRRYAKRQITWWAKDEEINWFHPDQKEEILKFAADSISGRIL